MPVLLVPILLMPALLMPALLSDGRAGDDRAMVDARTARRMWTLVEPLHVVTYFAPEPQEAFRAAGLRGFWRGYFAGRSAPLGPVGAAPVEALFYGFAPAMVARALPAVWSLAAPDVVLAARSDGAVAALTALRPDDDAVPDTALGEAAELVQVAVAGAETGGRALGAANAALPWPGSPLAALWHAATVLRELRGDGHVAALVAAGVTGLEALVLRAGKDLQRAVVQPARGWTDDEWAAAADALRDRGLLDAADRITDAGRELTQDVETVTDHLATVPWRALGTAGTERFAELILPLSQAAATVLPAMTPIGLPSPQSV